jgi:hypothetical protein
VLQVLMRDNVFRGERESEAGMRRTDDEVEKGR